MNMTTWDSIWSHHDRCIATSHQMTSQWSSHMVALWWQTFGDCEITIWRPFWTSVALWKWTRWYHLMSLGASSQKNCHDDFRMESPNVTWESQCDIFLKFPSDSSQSNSDFSMESSKNGHMWVKIRWTKDSSYGSS